MKILLSLSLLLGFSVPAIAHNEFNGGSAMHVIGGVLNLPNPNPNPMPMPMPPMDEGGEGAETEGGEGAETEGGEEGPNRENID